MSRFECVTAADSPELILKIAPITLIALLTFKEKCRYQVVSVLTSLIWVRTFCKGYQQTILNSSF